MSDHDIEILGQKMSFPKTIHGAITAVVFSIVITIIVYIALVIAGDTTSSIVNRLVIGKTIDGENLNEDIYQIQFWTPSKDTEPHVDDSDQQWQRDVIARNNVKKENESFGVKLTSNSKVNGYRRHEVYGKGRSDAKSGYWWVLTVNKDYDVSEFVTEYQKYWKTKDAVYVEVSNYNGNYE
jgi:hypothetical protein